MKENDYSAYYNAAFDNLNAVAAREAELSELRICELSLLADYFLDFIKELSEQELELYEMIPLLSEELSRMPAVADVHERALDENRARLAFSALRTCLLDKVRLAELITERSEKITEASLLFTTAAAPTFIYQKNAYSDEAYDVLTENIPEASVVKYSGGIKEAAAAVADGAACYCLLPLEEMGVRIASVSELIAAYDLKINDVTSVFGFDGTADMKYAMLSRGYRVPERAALDDRYLEIRHAASAEVDISDIIYAATALGHRVYRLNTYRYIGDMAGQMYYSLVLRDDEGDFSAMLFYLSLFSPDTSVVGIYKNLE